MDEGKKGDGKMSQKEKLINDFRIAFNNFMSSDKNEPIDFINLFYAFENTRYLGIPIIVLEDTMIGILNGNQSK